MTETTTPEVTILPDTASLGDALYEADELRGAAGAIARLLDNLRYSPTPRTREWVIATVESLRYDVGRTLERADRLYHEVLATTDAWVEALEDAEAEAEDDWEAQETVRCHDCGAPATGTGTCAHARHDCTGGVALCTACGTSELHVDDWTPDVV